MFSKITCLLDTSLLNLIKFNLLRGIFKKNCLKCRVAILYNIFQMLLEGLQALVKNRRCKENVTLLLLDCEDFNGTERLLL